MNWKCEPCGAPIEPGQKALVARRTPEGGVSLLFHCEHIPFDENDGTILAVLGSAGCATRWFENFLEQIIGCKHDRRPS